MECQELLPEGQVFEDEVVGRTERGDHPADEVSEQYNHGKNRNRKAPQSLVSKSLILRVHEVLMRGSTIASRPSLPAVSDADQERPF